MPAHAQRFVIIQPASVSTSSRTEVGLPSRDGPYNFHYALGTLAHDCRNGCRRVHRVSGPAGSTSTVGHARSVDRGLEQQGRRDTRVAVIATAAGADGAPEWRYAQAAH